jgi:mono/diheme cytochrome c family protein
MSVWLAALLLVPMLQSEKAPTGNAEAGRVFWQEQLCQYCHGTVGGGGWGPDLAGRALTLAQFTRAVRQPWGLMPSYATTQVNDQAMADLHAYLSALPRPANPGPPRWRHPPADAPVGQRLQSAFGCSQCHGPEMLVPRAWLLSADRPGAVPDEKFGVTREAGFPYFAKMVYDHSEKYPMGTMGNFSRDILPEVLLRDIYQFMLDAGLRVRVASELSAGVPKNGNTTYTLKVANLGWSKGPDMEEVTIFVRIPPGTSVVGATGTGYSGVRPLAKLGLEPALAVAPGAFSANLPQRPKPDLAGDVAVWRVPRIPASGADVFTLTLSGAGPTPQVLQGFGGSTVHWARPAPRIAARELAFRDLRVPDRGDHMRIPLPSPPRSQP